MDERQLIDVGIDVYIYKKGTLQALLYPKSFVVCFFSMQSGQETLLAIDFVVQALELSRYPAMFCDSNCGSCIAEDTKIATIRVDLAQLNRLCAETNPSCVPAEAVRAVDSQDEAREENIGCQEPLRNAGCSGADTKPLTVTQCPQDELQAFVSPEVSRQLEVCPESATDSCGGGSDDFHEAPTKGGTEGDSGTVLEEARLQRNKCTKTLTFEFHLCTA